MKPFQRVSASYSSSLPMIFTEILAGAQTIICPAFEILPLFWQILSLHSECEMYASPFSTVSVRAIPLFPTNSFVKSFSREYICSSPSMFTQSRKCSSPCIFESNKPAASSITKRKIKISAFLKSFIFVFALPFRI